MTATRRLAAILAADFAGYSRLIGADEGGTLQALRAVRAELIDPTIAARNGRLVKTTGDGLLVEFGSVVDALRCATEVQAGMAERNTTVSNDRRIEFRIGINVGDIVVEDGDIFGDGVNIAARLEALAEPGGICVSPRTKLNILRQLIGGVPPRCCNTLPVRTPRFTPSEAIPYAKRKKPTWSKRREPAPRRGTLTTPAVLADLDPELYGLPFGVPVGVLGEGEEHRGLR